MKYVVSFISSSDFWIRLKLFKTNYTVTLIEFGIDFSILISSHIVQASCNIFVFSYQSNFYIKSKSCSLLSSSNFNSKYDNKDRSHNKKESQCKTIDNHNPWIVLFYIFLVNVQGIVWVLVYRSGLNDKIKSTSNFKLL